MSETFSGGWTLNIMPSVAIAAGVNVSGCATTPQDLGLTNALVTLTNSKINSLTTMPGKFGSYTFRDAEAGRDAESGDTYILTVSSKRDTYAQQIISPTENLAETAFTPQ